MRPCREIRRAITISSRSINRKLKHALIHSFDSAGEGPGGAMRLEHCDIYGLKSRNTSDMLGSGRTRHIT
jgi:hypothetical protein